MPEILFLKKGTHKNHGMFSSNGKRINLICIPKSLNTKFKRLYFVKKKWLLSFNEEIYIINNLMVLCILNSQDCNCWKNNQDEYIAKIHQHGEHLLFLLLSY